jgi:hypothetical protein
MYEGEDYYWGVNLNSSSLGDEFTFDLSTNEIIIDSGTSLLSLPPTEFTQLADYFNQTMDCEINDENLIICSGC